MSSLLEILGFLYISITLSCFLLASSKILKVDWAKFSSLAYLALSKILWISSAVA